MGTLIDFITGTKVLEEVASPINGKIEVFKSLAFGTYIQVDGLTQSGGILKDVWQKSLKRARGQKLEVKNCLILGLGAGTVAGLVRRFWPESQITGVDLDPKMVDLGRKYFKLDEIGAKVFIGDVFEVLKKRLNSKKYDLVLTDIYIGHEYPQKLEDENYIQLVRSVLVGGGVAIFNRLYYGEKRPLAMKFAGKLEKIFKKVDVVFPEANVMFMCSK